MDADIVHMVATALLTAVKLSGPILVATLVIGLVVSIVQSATQIQEQTLSFVPKLLVAAIVLVITGSWCLRVLTTFTRALFDSIPTLLGN